MRSTPSRRATATGALIAAAALIAVAVPSGAATATSAPVSAPLGGITAGTKADPGALPHLQRLLTFLDDEVKALENAVGV